MVPVFRFCSKNQTLRQNRIGRPRMQRAKIAVRSLNNITAVQINLLAMKAKNQRQFSNHKHITKRLTLIRPIHRKIRPIHRNDVSNIGFVCQPYQ